MKSISQRRMEKRSEGPPCRQSGGISKTADDLSIVLFLIISDLCPLLVPA
jgi:hypothetical protein